MENLLVCWLDETGLLTLRRVVNCPVNRKNIRSLLFTFLFTISAPSPRFQSMNACGKSHLKNLPINAGMNCLQKCLFMARPCFRYTERAMLAHKLSSNSESAQRQVAKATEVDKSWPDPPLIYGFISLACSPQNPTT